MDNSFMPQPFSATTARRRQEELARQLQRLDGAARTGNATVPAGSTLELEGGINVPGGYIIVRDKGEVAVVGEGTDRYTGQDVTVTTTFGNREVEEPWTGISVLRPGIWLESSSYPADPGNLASLTSRYGDNVEIKSLEYADGNGGRWRSSVNIDPAGASIGWSLQDGDPTSPTTGGTRLSGNLSVSLDAPMEVGSYARNAAPDDPAVIHTEAALQVGAWGGQLPTNGTVLKHDRYSYDGTYISRGSLRFDKNGLMALHSEKGANKVDFTHSGDGVLNLSGSNGVNVNGSFTVNGSPVGGAVTSVAGKTGDVILVKGDVGLGNVDNTADANKPVSTAQQAAINALKPTAWTTVTAAASWEGQSTDPVQVRTINGSGQLRGKFHYLGANTTAGNNSASSLLMGTLPSGTWPPYEVNHVAMAIWGASSVLTPCRVAIGTDGQIRLYGLGSQGVFTAFDVRTTTYVYMGDLTYPL